MRILGFLVDDLSTTGRLVYDISGRGLPRSFWAHGYFSQKSSNWLDSLLLAFEEIIIEK
jgi:hypothetical protein